MLTYLLQMIACSGILYGYYHLFLRNERFHQYNRFYLLFSIAVSVILPLVKIPVLLEKEDNINPVYLFVSTGENIVVSAKEKFDASLILYLVYILVVLLLLIRIGLSINKIINIKRNAVTEEIEEIRFINTTHPDAPFSFFKWLFWNSNTPLRSAEGEQIFKHEMYHIRSKHSWDLIFMELILAVFWFNPLFYLYRKELKTIQEFLADKHAAEGYDATSYAKLLLLQALGNRHHQLVNPFFHNQLKRRIAMLTTSKKPAYQWLRKLLVLPIVAISVALFGFTYKKEIKEAVATLPEIPGSISSGVSASLPIAVDHPPKDTVPIKKDITDVKTNNLRTAPAEYTTESKRYLPLNPVTIVTYQDKKPERRVLKEGETMVDVGAAFRGNWSNFLERNLDGDVAKDNGAPVGTYNVLVKFTVNTDGSLSDFIPVTDEGFGMEEEVIRVLKKSPDWSPAVNNKLGYGKEVKSYRTQPVTFQVVREVKKDNAQITPPPAINKKEPEIFTKVEIDPKYPGNWRDFLFKNLNLQLPIDNGAPPGNYTTIIQFIVNKDGSTRDFKALTNVGYGLEAEALRVMKETGKWKPAMQNGHTVTAYRKQPITFQVTEQ